MALAGDLKRLLPPDAVIEEPEQLRTYECDGLTGHRVVPSLVVLPATTEEVAGGRPRVRRGGRAVRRARRRHGALRRRAAGRRRRRDLARADEPGAARRPRRGADHRAARRDEPAGDRGGDRATAGTTRPTRPASRSARSAATSPRTRAARTASSTASRSTTSSSCSSCFPTARSSGSTSESPGPDLLGAFVGSEGTLGIATEVTLRLLRRPEAVRTVLAAFDSTDDAGAAVSGIVAAGILPSAMEMMDRLTIEAAEAAVHPGYPDANALLLVELDGRRRRSRRTSPRSSGSAATAGAWEIRTAADDHERALLWKGRKSAFAAMGRVSPGLLRPGRRRAADEAARGAAADRGALERVRAARRQRLPCRRRQPPPARALRRRGRGAGRAGAAAGRGDPRGVHRRRRLDDRRARHRRRQGVLDAAALRRRRPRGDAAVPRRRSTRPGCATPGSCFPTPRLCGEVPGPYRAHPLEKAGLAERL